MYRSLFVAFDRASDKRIAESKDAGAATKAGDYGK